MVREGNVKRGGNISVGDGRGAGISREGLEP